MADTSSEGIGKMDWNECVRNRISKKVNEDKNLIKSAREIAGLKVKYFS